MESEHDRQQRPGRCGGEELMAKATAVEFKWMVWSKAWEISSRAYGAFPELVAAFRNCTARSISPAHCAGMPESAEKEAKNAKLHEDCARRKFDNLASNSDVACEDERRWNECVEHVKWIAHNAAWHANNIRKGNSQGAEMDKDRFESRAKRLSTNSTLPPRIASSLKWMCWNAAWHAANSRAHFHADARKDKCLFRKHARMLHRREEHGVNLGGWLLLERWMCAGVFRGTNACDEFSLSSSGPEAVARIREWRETFITQQDFAAIRRCGFSCVRVPFGHWCIDTDGSVDPAPYVDGRGMLERAVGWAEGAGLSVILDLHSAPGGQSGHQASGRDSRQWQPADWDMPQTVLVLRCAARAFAHRKCVTGMTVVNEPSAEVDDRSLVGFYLAAYGAIRESMRAEDVTVYLPVFCRPIAGLVAAGLRPEGLSNVRVDVHLYQCFGEAWQRRGVQDHLQRAQSGRGHCPGLEEVLCAGFEAAVGEWSLRLPTWNDQWPAAREWRAMSDHRRASTLRDFAANQGCQYGRLASGWTFWTWKVDAAGRDERQWRHAPPEQPGSPAPPASL